MNIKRLLFIATTILMASCSKENQSLPLDVTQQNSSVETKNNLEDYEQEFLTFFDLQEPDELLLIYSKNNGNLTWDVIKSDKHINERRSALKHKCTGSALQVLRCTQAIIDAGGCVISGKTNGEYWADPIDCPEE